MAIKRSLLICLIVCIMLFLPGMFYFFNGGYVHQVVNIIDGSGSADKGAEFEEKIAINFSGLIYGPDKAELVTEKIEYWHLLAEKRAEEERIRKEEEAARAAEKRAIEERIRADLETARASEGRATASAASTSQKEQEMINYINRARSNAGLPSLSYCSQLTNAARAKSRDMIDNNYFAHTSPRYGGLGGLLGNFGISYRSAGENLAMNSNGSVSAAHSSLMNSSGHRANILGSNFSRVGVGIQVKSDGSHYYTQLFTGH